MYVYGQKLTESINSKVIFHVCEHGFNALSTEDFPSNL